MTANPRHRPKGWLRYGETALRAAIAEDRRLRRRAARLRVDIRKARGAGGWELSSRSDGAIIVGPRAFDWQIAEALDRLFVQARTEGLL